MVNPRPQPLQEQPVTKAETSQQNILVETINMKQGSSKAMSSTWYSQIALKTRSCCVANLSSQVAPQVVIMTTCSAIRVNKVGITTTLHFHWVPTLYHHVINIKPCNIATASKKKFSLAAESEQILSHNNQPKLDGIIKWTHFLHYWSFVWGIHRSLVNSLHKGQWCRDLMFSLICPITNGWARNQDASDLRCHHAHYDVTVMKLLIYTSI